MNSRFVSLCVVCPFVLCAARSVGAQTPGDSSGVRADMRTTVASIAHDQKTDFLRFPSELVHGKNWLPVVLVSAATAGLVAADQHDTSYFRSTTSFHGYNSVMSGAGTAAGIIAVPVVLYAFGHFEQDTYAKRSALLAAEAAVDGEIAAEVIKLITQRRRPQDLSSHANYADSFWDSKSVLDPSFPSDHAISAFSVATVVAERYGRQHRWVPFVSYGLATAVGFSRVTSSAHYPSDVFFGAALGYVIGHFTVMGAR